MPQIRSPDTFTSFQRGNVSRKGVVFSQSIPHCRDREILGTFAQFLWAVLDPGCRKNRGERVPVGKAAGHGTWTSRAGTFRRSSSAREIGFPWEESSTGERSRAGEIPGESGNAPRKGESGSRVSSQLRLVRAGEWVSELVSE